jgi:hypothetical protein
MEIVFIKLSCRYATQKNALAYFPKSVNYSCRKLYNTGQLFNVSPFNFFYPVRIS